MFMLFICLYLSCIIYPLTQHTNTHPIYIYIYIYIQITIHPFLYIYTYTCRLSSNVSAYAKAARVAEFLEEMLTKVYITARQLAVLMELFTQGNIWKAEPFGTYRVCVQGDVYIYICILCI